jgi:GxxExxY protein
MALDRENEAAKIVVDAAIAVHRELGPGLLESAYKLCLAQELALRGCSVRLEVPVSLEYAGTFLNKIYAIDLLVNECLIVEVKAVEGLHPLHEAQVLTYLKLTGRPLALLINFNEILLRDGLRRIILTEDRRPRTVRAEIEPQRNEGR